VPCAVQAGSVTVQYCLCVLFLYAASGGVRRMQIQEFVEAATFVHWCQEGSLLTLEALNGSLEGLKDADGRPFFVSDQDYLLGVSARGCIDTIQPSHTQLSCACLQTPLP